MENSSSTSIVTNAQITQSQPRLAHAERERAFFCKCDKPMKESATMRAHLRELRGLVCLPESVRSLVPSSMQWEIRDVEGLRDDNRCLILPQYSTKIGEMTYYLDVKGVGARMPMYGFRMPEKGYFAWGSRFKENPIAEHWMTRTTNAPQYTGEMWFGNGPYGAHGTRESLDSVAITEMCNEGGNSINGFYICPVLFSIQLPEFIVEGRKDNYWYRKWKGLWSQQFRLIPSNIRLYFHSDCTLGISPRKVLSIYGVESKECLDRFIENYMASGLAATTLAARTAKIVNDAHGGHFEALDYDDVWLDKDSIIAPDGTIHFADIDDLEWRVFNDEASMKKKFRRQLERNFFEFMFGLDALLSEAYLMQEREYSPSERRMDVAARFEMALMTDEYVKTENTNSGLDILVDAPGVIKEPERIRLIDFE